MKNLIWQFYNEGLATTFYLKPLKLINKYIRNNKILCVLKILLLIIYTSFVLILAWFIFWDRYPL